MIFFAVSILTLAALLAAFPTNTRNNAASIPLTRRLNVPSGQTLPEIDKARAQAFKSTAAQRAQKDSSITPVPVTNTAVLYTAEVLIGEPPQTFDLIVDIGSSSTWIGANTSNPYTPTNTSTATSTILCVQFIEYGSGLFIGLEYNDTVTIGGLSIPNQTIGDAQWALGFEAGVDGILGLGLLDAYEVGIAFAPPNSTSDPNGELTFGGVDSSKFNGDLTYTNITTTYPAMDYVGFNQSVTFGNQTLLSNTAGIVDTGTTLVELASDAFATYQNLTGAVLDSTTGLLTISSAQLDNLPSLFFIIENATFELTSNAQLWPRALNSAIGGKNDSIYLIVSDLGTPSGEGLDFVNGYAFLERFYAVYDTGNSRVGFATTPFTFSTSN
ncbi:uncharacterized protein PHACADRAFT_31478 [Phanerochaete carnosa HHB-10118-sp]|uniref:Peptidase A1 domain-containing protein n=1 Tax=Phanerochaete carnosa (strain HHB-10118-sp) TaxID=650164 RepID=K5VYG6_PHACS|nr:uncharacterized protein PHACADRAFT_31478 [Phanerochaete carnosa HHB-10118-sp]EKM51654.1 hypothetical protein PHACADRAFT_31478 [Phanerochaete carnosa HHB-10118-sp]